MCFHLDLNEIISVQNFLFEFCLSVFKTLFSIQDVIFNEEEVLAEEVILMCTWCIGSKESDMAWTVELIKGDVMVPD